MMTTKEDSVKSLEKFVADVKADHEDSIGAVVISVDKDEGTIKLMGMNLDEQDILDMLEEAAVILVEAIHQDTHNRTLN